MLTRTIAKLTHSIYSPLSDETHLSYHTALLSGARIASFCYASVSDDALKRTWRCGC